VVVDSWRTGLVLNAVVLWNTRCTEGLGGSRLGDDRGHDGGLHHLTRGQRHNGDQDERNRGPGWKQVHEQETANATIGAFPRGLPQSRSPRPAPEKAVGQEARESVNRLIIAEGPADRLAAASDPDRAEALQQGIERRCQYGRIARQPEAARTEPFEVPAHGLQIRVPDLG
jgi:hypothetical protein